MATALKSDNTELKSFIEEVRRGANAQYESPQYKKLLALTGKSPIEFIRSIRVQRAAQLLEQSQLTVSEIAYEVGFNNPKYFTRYFKAEYHCLPSAYASRKKESRISAD